MTITTGAVGSALWRAAIHATCAPSVHNTQPWRLVVRRDGLDLRLDRTHQLAVIDPLGRQLILSAGAALLNARVSFAAGELDPDIARFPDRLDRDLVARLDIDDLAVAADAGRQPETSAGITGPAPLAALESVVAIRATNRRRFVDEQMSDSLVDVVVTAAAAEGAHAVCLRDPGRLLTVAALSRYADNVENRDPAYRAELRARTHDEPPVDGEPTPAVPHVDGCWRDDISLRDFDTSGPGYLPAVTTSDRRQRQCLLLIATDGDGPPDWLTAGEAVERVLLEVARHEYAASPLSQISEVPSVRARLRRELGMQQFPQVILRIGRAPSAPASLRRRLTDVITDQRDQG